MAKLSDTNRYGSSRFCLIPSLRGGILLVYFAFLIWIVVLLSACQALRLPPCEGYQIEVPSGYYCQSERADLLGERKLIYGRVPRERDLQRPREEIIFDK